MSSKPISMKELPEAVAAYEGIVSRLAKLEWHEEFAIEQEREHMTRLMDLLQEQTPFIEKRFWKLVDERIAVMVGA